jgi:PAS domain S-box-containing protein
MELIEHAPTPFWVMGPEADLWFGNRAWSALTSAAAAPARRSGTGWLQALHEDDRSLALTAFRAAASSRERVEIDLRLLSAVGDRWWSFVVTPIRTEAGVDICVGVAHDVSAAREAEQRLREVGARLVTAQESERARIARELHDDVAQRVALLTAKLWSTQQTRPFSTTLARRTLDDVREMLHELTNGIRLLSSELHPPNLALLGLGPTIKAFCDEIAESSGIAVRFTDGMTPLRVLAEETALCVFRVTQEALQNVVKHSGGRHADVRLRLDGAQLTLWVVDDGVGFDTKALRGGGLGLMTMQERVELLGGRLRVISEPACGTVVEAIVPVPPPAPAE